MHNKYKGLFSLKKVLSSIAIIIIIYIGFMFSFSECSNKCGSTTCSNGGTCTDNKCVCPMGFSGNGCQTGWSDEFAGTYKCTQSNCSPASAVSDTLTWLSTIAKASTNPGYTITITNFDNSNITQTATVDSIGGLTMAPVSGNYGVSGKGTYLNGVITLNFGTYTLGGVPNHCEMKLVKQ